MFQVSELRPAEHGNGCFNWHVFAEFADREDAFLCRDALNHDNGRPRYSVFQKVA